MSAAVLRQIKLVAMVISMCGFWSWSVRGQIGGTGWQPLTVNFKIQSPTNTPQSTRYFFTNNIYHCLTFSNDGAFSVGNTTSPRTEQRFNPDYTGGEIQYQATMMAPGNENSYCVFQIHTGDAQSPQFGSTTFMAFWFTNNNGSVHDYSGTTLATNLGNKWFQLNVDHNMVTHTIRVWIDQKLVWTQQDNGASDFYFKDGVYEQSHGPTLQMDTFITNTIKEWVSSGTNPPAPPTGLAATPTLSQIPLTWNSSVAATNYNLKRSTTNGGPYPVIKNLSGTNYTDATAVSGTTYYYVVSALDQFGESSNSTQIAASLFNLGYQLSVAPPAPSMFIGSSTNLTVTMITNTTFSGTVTLGIAGLPANTTASFTPSSLSLAGTSTLTIQTATNTLPGNYVVAISGTNGASIYTIPVNLALTTTSAAPGTMVWTGGAAGTNWSQTLNWTNMTAGGFGPPGISNDVVFTSLATVASSNTVNNVVNSSTAINSLTFNQPAAFHTTQIVPGSTLAIFGSQGLTVGTESDAGSTAGVFDAITGTGGTLICSNSSANVVVRQGAATNGSQRARLDLSGLDTFTATVNQVSIGVAGPVIRATGTLRLAKTNMITATGALGILVGDNNSNGGGQNYFYLGQCNFIFADNITIGRQKSSGTLGFNPTLADATAYFRGADGSGRLANWLVGDNSAQSASGTTTRGTADLSGGSVDALVDTLVVGKGQKTTGVDTFGTLTFAAGTLDVNTLQIGLQAQSDATSGGNGTVNLNGGLVSVNRILELGHASGIGATDTIGVLNLNGGMVQTTNIAGGGGVSTINLNSGLINLKPAGVPGNLANISTLNVGAAGVDDDALLTGAANISVSNAIIIAANGTLAGNTFITSPGLTVNGTLSPGANGTGAITNSGTTVFGAGGIFTVTVQDANSAPVAGWDFLQTGGKLDIAASAANVFTIQLQSFDPGGSGLVTNFNAGSNYVWTIATAAGGITNFSANKFAVDASGFQNALGGGSFSVQTNGNALQLWFVPPAPSVISGIWLNGANLVINGSGGTAGGNYYALASTNLSLPANQWQRVATNSFDSAGHFTFTNDLSGNEPQRFYIIQLP